MKKFILGLFLVLGVVSIAAPEYVDVKGMEKKGYIIYKNKNDSLVIFKLTQNDRIGVTLYFSDEDNAEYVTNTFKRSAPSALQFLDETENDRAYIQRFKEKNGTLYIYNIIAKVQKVNGCYITFTFSDIDNLTEENLNEKINILLDEIESFLK